MGVELDSSMVDDDDDDDVRELEGKLAVMILRSIGKLIELKWQVMCRNDWSIWIP